jgi:hypothetical protein
VKRLRFGLLGRECRCRRRSSRERYSRIGPPPVVVIRELCEVAEVVRRLYVSDDWQFVRGSLTPQSRTEGAQVLRAVAFVAQTMAESSEKPQDGESEPPTNYGREK